MTTVTEEAIKKGSEVSSTRRVVFNSLVSWGAAGKGVVKSIDSKRHFAEVEYEIPNTPMVCAKCGMMSELSVSGNDGEVVCMATGCGHGHGFQKVLVALPLAQLELYSAYLNRKEERAWRAELEQKKSALQEAKDALQAHRGRGSLRGWVG